MCETNSLESLTLKALDKLLVDYSNHLLLVGQTINFVVFHSGLILHPNYAIGWCFFPIKLLAKYVLLFHYYYLLVQTQISGCQPKFLLYCFSVFLFFVLCIFWLKGPSPLFHALVFSSQNHEIINHKSKIIINE